MIRHLLAALTFAVPLSASALAEPFKDAQNRVWYLSYPGGMQYEEMALRFDPSTGYARDQSGLRWATASEVNSLYGQMDTEGFFSRYRPTYGKYPDLSMWIDDPSLVPTGAAVFGGVVREPLYFGQFLGSPSQLLQTNVYFSSSWEVLGLQGPQDDWVIVFGPLVGGGGGIPLYGEVTQDGMWVYQFVPSPETLTLSLFGLLALRSSIQRSRS